MNGASFLVRVRHSGGCLRVPLEGPSSTVLDLKRAVASLLPGYSASAAQSATDWFSLTLNGREGEASLENSQTMQNLGAERGHLFYLKVQQNAVPNANGATRSATSRKRRTPPRASGNALPEGQPVRRRVGAPQASAVASSSSSSGSGIGATTSAMAWASGQLGSASASASASSLTSSSVHTLANLRPSSNANPSSSPATSSRRSTRQRKESPKKKKKKKEIFALPHEGGTAQEIASHFLHDDALAGAENLEQVPLSAALQRAAAMRAKAVRQRRFQINEALQPSDFTSAARSRGVRFLLVTYGGRKAVEQARFYTDELIGDVIYSVLDKHFSVKRRCTKAGIPPPPGQREPAAVEEEDSEEVKRAETPKLSTEQKKAVKACAEHLCERDRLFSVEQLAVRSPCMLWSLCHSFPEAEVQATVQKLVQRSLKTLCKRRLF